MISNRHFNTIMDNNYYIYTINIYITCTKQSFNITTSNLKCQNKIDIMDFGFHNIQLPKKYNMTSKTKTLRYLKEQIYIDLYDYITKTNNKINRNNFEIDINFTIDTTHLSYTNDESQCTNIYKYEYSEDNISWYNYITSMMYGKVNIETCKKHKPFYLKVYYESDAVEDKLDMSYTKLMSFDNPNMLSYINNNKYNCINIKNINIEYIDGVNIYYNENANGTFDVIVLLFDDYMDTTYGVFRKIWTLNKIKWYCDDIACMLFKYYSCDYIK